MAAGLPGVAVVFAGVETRTRTGVEDAGRTRVGRECDDHGAVGQSFATLRGIPLVGTPAVDLAAAAACIHDRVDERIRCEAARAH